MQFVNPGFLYALSAIAIPIIIHLFNFRRYKKEYFSNVRLLKELQIKTKRRSRLKHLILLFLRILAIISIVLAFAQPYFPSENSLIRPQESSSVLIYIDNSFSMANESQEGVLIEDAKNKAREIAASFKPSDKFALITNEFKSGSQNFISLEDFDDQIDEVKVAPEFRFLSSVSQRAVNQMQNAASYNKIVYLVSDFQKVSSDLADVRLDTNMHFFLVPLQASEQGNIYIDSCWIESPVLLPEQQVELFVRLQNASNTDVEKLPVKLELNNRQRAVASVDIEHGSSAITSLQFTIHEAGILQGFVFINDYPVSFDDKYFVSLRAEKEINVLEIFEDAPNPYLKALFENDSTFVLQSRAVNQMDYSILNDFDLIILSHLHHIPSGLQDVVMDFAAQGGSLLLVPPVTDIDMDSYREIQSAFGLNEFTSIDTSSQRVEYIKLEDPFFDDVFVDVPENIDLPVSKQHYKQNNITRSLQVPLMMLQNGDVFLSGSIYKKGEVFVSNVAFDDASGNLVRHAMFVPVLYKIALSAGESRKLAYELGTSNRIEVDFSPDATDEMLKMKDTGSEFTFIPEVIRQNFRTFLDPHDQIHDAGNYNVVFRDEKVDGISFNYNRKESDLSSYTRDELKKQLNNLGLSNITLLENQEVSLTKAVTDINKGTRFWKLFIILALAFLAAEIAIIRLWK